MKEKQNGEELGEDTELIRDLPLLQSGSSVFPEQNSLLSFKILVTRNQRLHPHTHHNSWRKLLINY